MMNQYLKKIALLALIAVTFSAPNVRAATDAIESITDDSARTMMLEQAAAVDNISIELGLQGVVLTDDSAAVLNAYSQALKAEAAQPQVGSRLKNLLRKTGKGLKKAGGFVLKTMAYAGTVGAGVIFLPFTAVEGFVEGLVAGSDPSRPLEVTGIVTGVVLSGVVIAPLALSFPVVAVAGAGMGALNIPARLIMCNEDRGISEENEKFCDNWDTVTDYVFYGPADVSFAGGAKIHDGVAKIIKKIFHRRH